MSAKLAIAIAKRNLTRRRNAERKLQRSKIPFVLKSTKMPEKPTWKTWGLYYYSHQRGTWVLANHNKLINDFNQALGERNRLAKLMHLGREALRVVAFPSLASVRGALRKADMEYQRDHWVFV